MARPPEFRLANELNFSDDRPLTVNSIVVMYMTIKSLKDQWCRRKPHPVFPLFWMPTRLSATATGRSVHVWVPANTTACPGDFACVFVTSLGPFACETFCVCQAYLPDGGLTSLCN